MRAVGGLIHLNGRPAVRAVPFDEPRLIHLCRRPASAEKRPNLHKSFHRFGTRNPAAVGDRFAPIARSRFDPHRDFVKQPGRRKPRDFDIVNSDLFHVIAISLRALLLELKQEPLVNAI